MIYTELMICRRLLSLEVLEPRTDRAVAKRNPPFPFSSGPHYSTVTDFARFRG